MGKILVADDEQFVCELIKDALEYAGHNVDVVHSGEEALAAMQEKPYDVLLLDLVMPGMGGRGVLRRRDRFPNTKVIVLTAYASKESAIDAVRHNASDYIEKQNVLDDAVNRGDDFMGKPVSMNELRRRVESHISYYEFGLFAIDTVSRIAFYDGEEIDDMTPGLFDLFAIFVKTPSRKYTYQELAWEKTGKKMSNKRAKSHLRVQMHRLRKMLEGLVGNEFEPIVPGYGEGFGWHYRIRRASRAAPEENEEE